MTNGWIDMKNTDMMLIMGGNPAENHPCGFKWPTEARRHRNAKLIVVDPRFTRTASQADLFLQIRAGTDIAFLGGLINYALQNGRYNKEYVLNWTNAAFIVKDGFKLPDDGLFSGFDAKTSTYADKSTWNYEPGANQTPKDAALMAAVASTLVKPPKPPAAATTAAATAPKTKPAAKPAPSPGPSGGGHQAGGPVGAAAAGTTGGAPKPAPSLPPNTAYDLSLQNTNCVFQLLKKQYSRYTPEFVEKVTGIPKDQFTKAADMFTSVRKDGNMTKVATIIYAVGWTQHSFGSQMIRTAAVLQLLLGNVGRAGGGMNALRGHSNIQGATDMGGVYDILPGYLKIPGPQDHNLAEYLKRTTPGSAKPNEWDSFNYWSNTPRFMVSMFKAFYGDNATKDNDFGFHWWPKISRRYSWVEQFDRMYKGEIKGFMAFGMNAVMIGPNSKKTVDAMKKLDWAVVCEVFDDETSNFWQYPGTTKDEMKNINTTVYQLPGAGFAEKDGTFVNSARWLQWKYIAVPSPGEAKMDQEILARIYLKVKDLYAKEGGKNPDPIMKLSWAYSNPLNPSLTEVAKEINGKALQDVTDPATGTVIKAGQQLPGFAFLRDDGSTMCGMWLYCGSWTEAGPQMQRRGTEDPSGLGIFPNWGWSWPANRRVMYNRASCDLNGKPWDPSRKQVWWNDGAQRWVGNDVPDFKPDSHPKDHMGPFIMLPEGVGRLFAPLAAFADGPFPEYYEPYESPIENPLHPQQTVTPVSNAFMAKSPEDKYSKRGDEFDVVCTTYRLTEHYHYWTKNNPMIVQLVPEPFVEIPVELAKAKGIVGGDWVKVSSARNSYKARAMVTRRIRPMQIGGKTTYQIGIPIHWGYRGIAEQGATVTEPAEAGVTPNRTGGTPANALSPAVYDPNAYTPEYKGFMVKIEKA
jgi:formate dehydrogenase major subunit